VLSLVALVLLLTHPGLEGDIKARISFAIFGVSLLVLYSASTIYHSSVDDQHRLACGLLIMLRSYVLIAGTYTPFTLVTLDSTLGWALFYVSWGLAFSGIALKLFFTGRFKPVSTMMYVVMGWLIVFAYKPLMVSLSADGLYWLVAGGPISLFIVFS